MKLAFRAASDKRGCYPGGFSVQCNGTESTLSWFNVVIMIMILNSQIWYSSLKFWNLLDVLDHVIYSHTHVHVICMINSQTISCCTATNPRVLQKSTFHCVSNIVMGQINPDEFQLHNVLIYWCIFFNETFWVWVWVNLSMSYWITNVYFHNYLITHVFNQS